MPDLGYTSEPMGEPVSVKDKAPETRYPSLSLEDANVDKVTGGDCEVDAEYTATVRLRVNSISDGDMGKRIGFDVLSIDDFEPSDGGDEDETDDSMTADSEPKNGKKTPKALRYS